LGVLGLKMKTPLFDEHVRLGAKIVPFAGWDMPLQYRGIAQEVEAVRKRAGLFDVSHMGRISLHGQDALPFLDFLSANRILGKALSKAVYTVFCDETGGCIDDLLVYIIDPSHAFIVGNAANRQTDLAHLQKYARGYRVEIQDHFETDGILSLQGPLSAQIFPEAASLRRMHFMQKGALIISRTGYTGEDGFEFYGPNEEIKKLWSALPAEPCGLGARDVLRLEMGYALYGHELSTSINPLESVAAWSVKMDHYFLGKEALEKKKEPIALIGASKIPAREGYPIYYQNNQIGQITSGTFSPTLQKAIALGLVKNGPYDSVDVLIRGSLYPFSVASLPFIKTD
jgi:aminomethyltransferase